MKVKTRITFEAEYPLEMEFYDADEDVTLEMERVYIASNPISTLDVFEARGKGIFTVEVEKAEQNGNTKILAEREI